MMNRFSLTIFCLLSSSSARPSPAFRATHVPVPPCAIPVKLKYQYFSLERSSPVWESVRSRNFTVYAPADIPNPNMELIILLPSAK